MKLYNGKRKKATNFSIIKPAKPEREYTDADFIPVYAKETKEYIGEFNYGLRERGDKFFIYKDDKIDGVSKRFIKKPEMVIDEEPVEVDNTHVVIETTLQETI